MKQSNEYIPTFSDNKVLNFILVTLGLLLFMAIPTVIGVALVALIVSLNFNALEYFWYAFGRGLLFAIPVLYVFAVIIYLGKPISKTPKIDEEMNKYE